MLQPVAHAVCRPPAGLNYRANVWLDGVLIGSQSDIVGTFRYFDFDVSSLLGSASSTPHVLAVECFRPVDAAFPPGNNSTDLAISFVDWAPPPPDMNMGLWRSVEVSTFPGPVSVRYPQVATTLSDSVDTAHLSVTVEVENYSNETVTGSVVVAMPGLYSGSVTMPATVEAGVSKLVTLSSTQFSELVIAQPSLWWPWQMGEQTMHQLEVSFVLAGSSLTSDALSVAFGIRQTESELTADGYRLYKVNKQPILIRAGGWAPDLFQRITPERQDIEFGCVWLCVWLCLCVSPVIFWCELVCCAEPCCVRSYIRDMGLNAVRLEGKMQDDNFFATADKYGVLTIPGWCCCDAWQHWKAWKEEQHEVASASLTSQVCSGCA